MSVRLNVARLDNIVVTNERRLARAPSQLQRLPRVRRKIGLGNIHHWLRMVWWECTACHKRGCRAGAGRG